ncbi:MAG: penicillin acylase family protein [Pseudomonadota bacterium]
MRHARSRFTSVLIACAVGFASSAGAQDGPPTTELRGLSAPVQVFTPPTFVPSIVAENELDAAFMQGYLHARDRFFQMDFNRRVGSGTLSEMLGAAALGTDIQLRTIGLRRAAWESLAAAAPETRAILQSYANGVNAYVSANPLPPEYAPLELSSVPPWQPVDTVTIGKLLAFDLSDDLGEIDLTVDIGTYQAVGEIVGFDGTALFFEDTNRVAPPDDRLTIDGFFPAIGGIGKDAAVPKQSESFPRLSEERLQVATQLRDKYLSNPILSKMMLNTDDVGSNFWIVSGDVTDSGVPIIANDPHLSLDTPSVFYPWHINATDAEGNTSLNVTGVSFAGAPLVAQGCNDSLCWGSTVNPIDEMDFFFEDLRFNNVGLPTHTVYQGQLEPLIYIFQSYFFNQVGDGEPDNIARANVGVDGGAITFIVPRRNNGPIVDFVGAQGVSVQYTGFGATRELEAFFEMAKAKDVFEFEQASTKFDFGSQNFGVADTSGNIAYFAYAEIPVRTDLQTLGQPDGGVPPVFIRDGTGAAAHDWLPLQNPQVNQASPTEILSTAELPRLVNPASGYIANANNDPVGTSLDNNPLNQLRPGGGLYYSAQGAFSAYRQGRIDRLLQDAIAEGPVTVDQMKAFQGNAQMLDAELVLPHLLNAFQRASMPDAWPGLAQFAANPAIQGSIGVLAGWDFSTPTGIPQGYDPGDDPFDLQPPTQPEVIASIAATIWSTFRGQIIANTIDVTLSAIGLQDNLPSSRQAYNALKHHLDAFPTNQGVGASGINFFTNPDAPTPEDARDFALLGSLAGALELLQSDAFAPAFNNSQNPFDYQWGKLHRIVFDHPLGGPFSLPNGLYGLATHEGLEGVSRQGGYQVLDASSHSARADGANDFMFGGGPARRFVGQMVPDNPIYEQVVPGGQSGVLGSPLYANQLYVWLVNGYLPMFINPAVVGAISPTSEIFTPPN